jgi:hypothetical protein
MLRVSRGARLKTLLLKCFLESVFMRDLDRTCLEKHIKICILCHVIHILFLVLRKVNRHLATRTKARVPPMLGFPICKYYVFSSMLRMLTVLHINKFYFVTIIMLHTLVVHLSKVSVAAPLCGAKNLVYNTRDKPPGYGLLSFLPHTPPPLFSARL